VIEIHTGDTSGMKLGVPSPFDKSLYWPASSLQQLASVTAPLPIC
jgi:hypothetical protein